MGWVQWLQQRWKVESGFQVALILLVFAFTGTTVVLIKKPLFHYLFYDQVPLWATILYYVLVLPVYNAFLLLYGLVFRQFHFFWEFEKRFFSRIMSIFRKDKPKS